MPEVLSACVATRVMSKTEPGLSDKALSDVDFETPSFSDFPLSVPQSELLQEQICDSYLKEVATFCATDCYFGN